MSSLAIYKQQQEDLAYLHAMAEIALKSGKYPGYDHATIMNVFLTARALNVEPIIALNSGFNIINGKISMGAHFMVSLARRAGHSLRVEEWTKDKCVIVGVRKDNGDSVRVEYTYEEAHEANLTGKKPWRENRKSMLYCGAARQLFRVLFCDIAIAYDADEMNADEGLASLQDQSFEEISQKPLQPIIEVKPKPEPKIEQKIEPKANKEPCVRFESDEMNSMLRALELHLESDGIPSDRLCEWIEGRCQTKKKSAEHILKSCLEEKAIPMFKKSYRDWLGTPAQASA